jgi:hypothetical protein
MRSPLLSAALRGRGVGGWGCNPEGLSRGNFGSLKRYWEQSDSIEVRGFTFFVFVLYRLILKQKTILNLILKD